MIQMTRKYNLRYVDARRDVLRPPHNTIPAAVKIKKVLIR